MRSVEGHAGPVVSAAVVLKKGVNLRLFKDLEKNTIYQESRNFRAY